MKNNKDNLAQATLKQAICLIRSSSSIKLRVCVQTYI